MACGRRGYRSERDMAQRSILDTGVFTARIRPQDLRGAKCDIKMVSQFPG
jgi:hypothetical protein